MAIKHMKTGYSPRHCQISIWLYEPGCVLNLSLISIRALYMRTIPLVFLEMINETLEWGEPEECLVNF